MNLQEALAVARQPLRVTGLSDAVLAREVNALNEANAPVLVEVPALNSAFPVRAADVLLRLAAATRAHYGADVLEAQAFWGLLRYLGFFDSDHRCHMRLSDAGHRIPGNQRRVASEEVGIGLSVIIAELWVSAISRNRTATRTVDVDVALEDHAIGIRGHIRPVRQVGRRRPDYVLINESSTDENSFSVAVLESKGTKSQWYMYRQLASAAYQLQGLRVDGRRPPGLAVSALLNDLPVSVFALQTPDDHRDIDEAAVADEENGVRETDRGAQSIDDDSRNELRVDLDYEQLRPGGPEVSLSGDSVNAWILASSGLRASWAMIADLTGNDDAFRRWATRPMLNRLSRDASYERERTSVRLENGLDIRGTSNMVTLPGGRLEVLIGLEAEVDDALDRDDPRRILVAQRRLTPLREFSFRSDLDVDRVVSMNSDGTALVISPL
jgi:hypothetical protein